MIFLENPTDFFYILKLLAGKIDSIMQKQREEEDTAASTVCFPTNKTFQDGELEGLPMILSYAFVRSHESEPEDSDERVLTYRSLCLFSRNNEQYGEPSEDPELVKILEEESDANNGSFYVCDRTQTYCCKITKETRDYFFHMALQKVRITVFVPTDDDPFAVSDTRAEEVYCHYMPHLIYLTDDEGEILAPIEDITGPTLVKYYQDEDGDLFCEAEELTTEDFFGDDPEDQASVDERREFLKSKIAQMQETYCKRLSSGEIREFTLFGQPVAADTSEKANFKMRVLSTVICVLNETFYNPSFEGWMQESLEECYQTLVEKTVSEGISAENIVKNLYDLLLPYSVAATTVLGVQEDAFRENAPTMLLYYFMRFVHRDLKDDVMACANRSQEEQIAQFEALPVSQYLNRFFDAMAEGAEAAAEYQESIENYNPGFVGGGFGIKGALKGMLAASFANAAAETIHTMYKTHQLSKTKYPDMLEEFMKSDASKQYLRELIQVDLKYLYLKMIHLFVETFLDTDPEEEDTFGLVPLKPLFADFQRSYRFYMTALAKHLQLHVTPDYEEMKPFASMSPLQLMEQAILAFPYDQGYYHKYLQLGGGMTEELKRFADLHMVELDSIYEQEKARIEKEKAEREEKERMLEEEKRRKAEEIRQANEAVIRTFGEAVVMKHPELFSALPGNPLFAKYMNDPLQTPAEIANAVFAYLEECHKGTTTCFYPVTSREFAAKQRNLASVYGAETVKGGSVLFFFDNTVFGSAKDGFVITKEYFCNRNMLETPVRIPIGEIRTVSIKENGIYINDTTKVEVTMCKLDQQTIVNILVFCFCRILALSEGIPAPESKPVSVPESAPSPAAPEGWTCSCGTVNPAGAKFCSECGSKKPEIPQEWVCPNCNTTNAATAKFCMECGTKKP